MKLLFDENLSRRLVNLLAAEFPDSTHVDIAGLRARPDVEIWEAARSGGFVIVSKDNDFRQLSFLHGAPPKVVWLSVGNASTAIIAELMRAEANRLRAFEAHPEASLMVLELAAIDDGESDSPPKS